ncbi:hypothetical protein [Streptomyces erythrochromogenes]|uniref:hypothetical protein n=1 Tax=Streptomyces erythrochromogenes TaxID=285574 RepID=UPI0038699310|nr:hypothetical protein OG364_06290 [Streptomyces erythrochromogenes]
MTAPVTVPTPQQIEQAADTLAQLVDYLRTEPPSADVLPLLTPLLDEDDGIPMLLSDVLRAAARAIATHAEPYSSDVRSVVTTLREAATEIMQWHSLHWDVRSLARAIASPPGAAS